MKCESPITRRYLDAITNEWKQCVCPCGKCAACRHNMADSWVVRLGEEARAKKSVIFETLTVAPESMYYVDMKEPEITNGKPCLYGTTEKWLNWKVNSWKKYKSFKRYYPHISYDSYKILRRNNFQKLVFPKDEVQKWIKRGRIAFKRHYGVDSNISYFLVQELGDITSRPHFHALIFGVSLPDYIRFWGNEWYQDFGFIKSKFIPYSVDKQKDISNTIRYVTKYLLKGYGDDALVKDGVYSKPYHLISKGLGSAYLESKKFNVFKNPEFTKWCEYGKCSLSTHLNRLNKYLGGNIHWHADTHSEGAIKESWDFIHKLRNNPGERADLKAYVDEILHYNKTAAKLKDLDDKRHEIEFLQTCCEDNEAKFDSLSRLKNESLDLSSLTDKDLNNLVVYYDNGAYPHALPRYYRTKLFNNVKEQNIYSNAIQTLLQSRARMLNNQSIAQFAYSMGYIVNPDGINEEKYSIEGLSPELAFMVIYEYHVTTKRKAKIECERCELKERNFFNRIKSRTDCPDLR